MGISNILEISIISSFSRPYKRASSKPILIRFFAKSTSFFMPNKRLIPVMGFSLLNFGRNGLKVRLNRVWIPWPKNPKSNDISKSGREHFSIDTTIYTYIFGPSLKGSEFPTIEK